MNIVARVLPIGAVLALGFAPVAVRASISPSETGGSKTLYVSTLENNWAEPKGEKKGEGFISGTVLDEFGEPLTGAIIRIPSIHKGTASGIKGDFSLSVPAGTYNVEVSFIGFSTIKVEGVEVLGGKSTPLNVVMQDAGEVLGEVVVTAHMNRATTAGALKLQQTMPQLATVMSAEQIGKTGDKHIGEALKRVTGITTTGGGKKIIVRGLGERWNEAMLDGVVLPSTETSGKGFDFSLIPSNLVENVTVIKSVTPDINVPFAGGLIQINTKDIPEKNFINFSAGLSYNDISTGKDQIHRARGKYDWLGFDDGRRDMIEGLKAIVIDPKDVPDNVYEVSKRMMARPDNLSMYKSKTQPSQNYSISIGRTFTLNEKRGDKLGLIAAISYRNTQQQTRINHLERGDYVSRLQYAEGMKPYVTDSVNSGAIYKYNTTIGAILNAGLQMGNHRFGLRNTFTRVYDNSLNTLKYRMDYTSTYKDKEQPYIRHFNSPTFQTLLQNKINGEHLLPHNIKLEWQLNHTLVRKDQKDVVHTEELPTNVLGKWYYYYSTAGYDRLKTGDIQYAYSPVTRSWYFNNERDYGWNIHIQIPLHKEGSKYRHTLKFGYDGLSQHNTFSFTDVQLTNVHTFNEGKNRPAELTQFEEAMKERGVDEGATYNLANYLNPENVGPAGLLWLTTNGGLDKFEAYGLQNDLFLMMDHRFSTWGRLIYGVRGSFYKYNEISNPPTNWQNASSHTDRNKLSERPFTLLPSVQFTYTPISDINIRLSYSQQVMRPHMSERTAFQYYDLLLNGSVYNYGGIVSSEVQGADLRFEWYPEAGEVLSVGGFYRYIKNPIELMAIRGTDGKSTNYYVSNNAWAKSYGMEFELRKNFGFIYDHEILRNLYLYGNATLLWSSVAQYYHFKDGKYLETPIIEDQERPLYGQAPYMFNIGLSYESETLGLNLALNRNGRKMMVIAQEFWNHQYEASANYLDAQISYSIPNTGLSFKLNGSNLLNVEPIIYSNGNDFERDETGNFDPSRKLKEGKTMGYDGDLLTERQHLWTSIGRTFSLSISYTL